MLISNLALINYGSLFSFEKGYFDKYLVVSHSYFIACKHK